MIVKIVFKNMESSQFVKGFIHERINPILDKFSSLQGHRITLTIEMENSPRQAGPDLFTVSSMVSGKIYKGLKVKRSSANFYLATAELAESLNQILGRESDRHFKNHFKSHLKSNKRQKNLTGENIYE